MRSSRASAAPGGADVRQVEVIHFRLPWWTGLYAQWARVREWPRRWYEEPYARIVLEHAKFKINDGCWWPLP